LAVLVSNVGLWMQTVGAQWLLVSQPNAAVLVALVQTADMLPDLMFGLVGGIPSIGAGCLSWSAPSWRSPPRP